MLYTLLWLDIICLGYMYLFTWYTRRTDGRIGQ